MFHPLIRLRHAIVGVIAFLACSVCLAGKPLHVGETAPNWILPNSQGQHVSFYQDSESKPAVILFWATWCPYCAALMPKLHELQQELANDDVAFYALNVWEEGDAVGYMAKHEYQFTLLLNADTVAKHYRVKGTPGLMVVDKDKVIRYIRTKGTSEDDAVAQVRAALLAN